MQVRLVLNCGHIIIVRLVRHLSPETELAGSVSGDKCPHGQASHSKRWVSLYIMLYIAEQRTSAGSCV